MLSKSPKSLVKFKEILQETYLWAPCVANRRKSHSSNIPHGNHSYFKGEEWGHIRKALAKTKTKSSRTNCKPSSFMSSIWGSWRHHLGSNGLGNPWFSRFFAHVSSLRDWPQSVPAIFSVNIPRLWHLQYPGSSTATSTSPSQFWT